MLLAERCEVMLPNRTQCPNPVITGVVLDTEAFGFNLKKCLLHNQLKTPQDINNVVDETNVNTNTIPSDKG